MVIRQDPTRCRSRRRPFVLLLLVMLSVVQVFQVSTAPKADAALHNLFPADSFGMPKGHFYSDEALFVTLVEDELPRTGPAIPVPLSVAISLMASMFGALLVLRARRATRGG